MSRGPSFLCDELAAKRKRYIRPGTTPGTSSYRLGGLKAHWESWVAAPLAATKGDKGPCRKVRQTGWKHS
jgi:hypothetical protein